MLGGTHSTLAFEDLGAFWARILWFSLAIADSQQFRDLVSSGTLKILCTLGQSFSNDSWSLGRISLQSFCNGAIPRIT